MRNIIDNFLRLSAQNGGEIVVWTLLAIYVGLLLISLIGIVLSKRMKGFKLSWGLAVLILPFVGMAFYCFYCLCAADYSLLGQLGVSGKTKKLATEKSQKSFST